MTKAPAPLLLYGAPCSLYTAKARSCLRKNAIPFEERFQSHPRYRETILKAANNHRIPVVEFADGAIVQDSTLIIDELQKRHPAIASPTGPLRVLELLVESFADRSLLKAAMHYRWNFPAENLDYITGEFGRILSFSSPQNWDEAGRSIAGRMSAYLPPLGITPESFPGIESAYLKLLDAMNTHFKQFPYILGSLPSRADYGLMGPLFAHLGRDPYPARIMLQKATLVYRWTERMNASETTSPEFPDMAPAWVDPAALPDTLVALLRRICIEYVPELAATAKAFEAWVAAHPEATAGTPVSPKADQPSFGQIEYQLEGSTVRQHSAGHTMWMHQRLMDAYAALPQGDKEATQSLLSAIGAGSILSVPAPRRLSRLQNRLSLA